MGARVPLITIIFSLFHFNQTSPVQFSLTRSQELAGSLPELPFAQLFGVHEALVFRVISSDPQSNPTMCRQYHPPVRIHSECARHRSSGWVCTVGGLGGGGRPWESWRVRTRVSLTSLDYSGNPSTVSPTPQSILFEFMDRL